MAVASWAIRATEWAIRATEEVAGDGISVEVLDLRMLVPLDREAVLRSVAKTGRLLIADGECVVVLHPIQRPLTV